MSKEEMVWVVPRKLWDEFIHFEGFRKDANGEIYRFLLQNGQFKPRKEMEKDFNWKQVIPQGLLRYQNKVYVNERLPKQSESRLIYSYSLGVGGHLNPEDDLIPHMDLIQLGLHREMAEEVKVPVPFSPKYIGLTNDERQEVSRVHVGVWFEVQVLSMDVTVKETDKIRGFWSDIDNLKILAPKFESWASIVYEEYLAKTRDS